MQNKRSFVSYWTLLPAQALCAAVMSNGSNRLNDAVFDSMCAFADNSVEQEKA